jgi:hypothetical protein
MQEIGAARIRAEDTEDVQKRAVQIRALLFNAEGEFAFWGGDS